MDIPRYHTCASLPTCRIYVHPFRNSFGLIELCRLSQDTRLTSDSYSSGWSFVIGFLHQGRCLPRLARLTRPSPVRADSGLSPHRHTCAAGRTKQTAQALLHARAVVVVPDSRRDQPALRSVMLSLNGVGIRTRDVRRQSTSSFPSRHCRQSSQGQRTYRRSSRD